MDGGFVFQWPSLSDAFEEYNEKDFGDMSERIPSTEIALENNCHELVIVTATNEWRIKELEETFPDYCWKYSEPSAIVFYHYSIAANANKDDAPSRSSNATFPVFYARLPYDFSPYDFSVQPKFLENVCMNLSSQLRCIYNCRDIPQLEKEQIVPGAACAVEIKGKWERGRILNAASDKDLLVDLVDRGTDNFISVERIRPLLRNFGRLPPLALRCRMKDVDSNDLVVSKLAEFRELLASCDGLVRVELADVSSVPYLVNLYHPTIMHKNLGAVFYSRGNMEREAHRAERWARKLAKLAGDDDEDLEYKTPDISEKPPSHVRFLDRLPKPMGEATLYISHIENSRLIYLHSDYHRAAIDKLERQLLEAWSSLPNLQPKKLEIGLACAYKDEAVENSSAHRVVVAEINELTILVRAADHGWKKILPTETCLKVLTREFDEIPLMYVCHLSDSSLVYPHISETAILRRLMPINSRVQVAFQRSKRPHMKVNLFLENGQSVAEQLEDIKSHERVLHPCFDVVPYRKYAHTSLLYSHSGNYVEELGLFIPFMKSRLTYAYLT